jgi:hypothetical protein
VRRLRSSLRGQGKWALLCSVALALIVSPFAVAGDGDVMKVGARNASDTRETRIIGEDVSTYATRQSNDKEGDGGSAAYGCRSSLANEPCLFVFNVRNGRAFDLRSRSNTAGRILAYGDQANPDNNKPFTTNATGVATGLNADEVDGQSADAFQVKTLIAAVRANGALDTNRSRGVSSVAKLGADGSYRVDFATDVSRCAYTATAVSTSNTGAVSLNPVDANTLSVITRRGGSGATNTDPQDRPFHLVVNC